ncbi:MAG: hypothetical protein QF847_02270 [Candidatus Marinimicrobia bacterium]|jgi:hypothetical protein|nr:hypothetical protein [Candidatus Neomarinimicrobiota bacterium]MDP6500385.1 hypothetical protein [Candidatus Neomarinimicrobiota bacterium]MDP6726063.1 hypothetical protein [Candidatus Neomarinimicrobiota bacterium]|tara:strand:- start:38551 stop:39117 length:567 start_codon:yes stop_codon:yes gene_type:complete
MASNVKTGIGFIIPFGALIGFVLSVLAENYVLGIFFAVAGVLIWLLYFAVMETAAPDIMGNFIILFGVLLSLAVFMNFGWEQNMWGGIEFKAEGSVMALVVLFFGTLSGVLYRQRLSVDGQQLTASEQELVDKALQGDDDPRVIVVKQEAETKDDDEEDDYDEYDEYDYAYPYYFDEDDDYEYDDDDD